MSAGERDRRPRRAGGSAVLRRVRFARFVLPGIVGIVVVAACDGGDLVVGDDTPVPDASVDRRLDDGRDAATEAEASVDATVDAADGAVVCMAPTGACIASTTKCRSWLDAGACNTGQYCCVTPCPTLSPPSPTLCDGGAVGALYDPFGCVVGYDCAPLGCEDAGGDCVALTPGSCKTNHVGNASTYSCGGGLGVQCCLP